MERTVPSTDSEEVELYLRTYYSLLRTSAEVQIRSLEEAHAGMVSLLHPLARSIQPDMSAFIYSLLRLPDIIFNIRLIVMGQSADVFMREQYGDVEHWKMVVAPARRRRYFFDGRETLATFIVSRSDIDDIVPMVTAFQLEWNKFHQLLERGYTLEHLEEVLLAPDCCDQIASRLEISLEDLQRLSTLWGDRFGEKIFQIRAHVCRLRIRLLNSSLTQYRRATHDWWTNIERANPSILERPIYFVSSNTHSLVNLLSGFTFQHRDELLSYLDGCGDADLQSEWAHIQTHQVSSSQENFLYYLLKKLLSTPEGAELQSRRLRYESDHAITRIFGSQSFDLQAQVIEIGAIEVDQLDQRLRNNSLEYLNQSQALILNIDYPLGMAAYQILSQVAERVREVRGIYIMGKSATLNGVVGDVMIPNVVHDEQSKNTYFFPNCFAANDVAPYLVYGTVLDNQKAVTVRGTFLQTVNYMDVFYREGYTDIEMEAGPYLSAVYEMFRPKRYPVDEIVNMHGLPFDIGILHYASDKPLSKGLNLGAGSLSYYGMDPTYAASLAILQHIFKQEKRHIESKL